jgi:hypothetical protein
LPSAAIGCLSGAICSELQHCYVLCRRSHADCQYQMSPSSLETLRSSRRLQDHRSSVLYVGRCNRCDAARGSIVYISESPSNRHQSWEMKEKTSLRHRTSYALISSEKLETGIVLIQGPLAALVIFMIQAPRHRGLQCHDTSQPIPSSLLVHLFLAPNPIPKLLPLSLSSKVESVSIFIS